MKTNLSDHVDGCRFCNWRKLVSTPKRVILDGKDHQQQIVTLNQKLDGKTNMIGVTIFGWERSANST